MLIFLKLSNSLIFFYQVYPLYTVHWVECVSTKNSVYDNSLTKHCDVCNLPYVTGFAKRDHLAQINVLSNERKYVANQCFARV